MSQPKPFNIIDRENMINHLGIMIANMNSMIEYFQTISVQTPCANCTFFDNGNCKKWSMAIPDDVTPIGCENFFFNRESAPF